jgi:hypothetical protein
MFCKHKTVGSSPIHSKFEHGVIGNVSALGADVMGSSPIVLIYKDILEFIKYLI